MGGPVKRWEMQLKNRKQVKVTYSDEQTELAFTCLSQKLMSDHSSAFTYGSSQPFFKELIFLLFRCLASLLCFLNSLNRILTTFAAPQLNLFLSPPFFYLVLSHAHSLFQRITCSDLDQIWISYMCTSLLTHLFDPSSFKSLLLLK